MKDMFNTTFFFLLGIIIIGVAGIYLYFENKLKDNTHKLNSMLNLVTSVTEEVRQIKFFLSSKNQPPNNYPVNKVNSQNGGNNLIEVSDNDNGNEDEDEDEEDDDDDDDDDEEDDEDDDDEEDEDDEDKDDDEDDKNDAKVKENKTESNDTKLLKIDIDFNNNLENKMTEIKDNEDNEDYEDGESDSSSLDSKLEILSIQDIEEMEGDKQDNKVSVSNDDEDELKYIMDPFKDTIDYKKLTVYNLRSIVSKKGLVEDPSKMKKNELLKLLTNE